MIRIGFWGPLYYIRNPENSIGNYYSHYSTYSFPVSCRQGLIFSALKVSDANTADGQNPA